MGRQLKIRVAVYYLKTFHHYNNFELKMFSKTYEIRGSQASLVWEMKEPELFSGMFDCNKQELYEGDYIRSFDSTGAPIIHRIEFDEFDGKYNARQGWIDEFKKEKIGSIHETPQYESQIVKMI